MRAIVCTKYGSPDVLELREVEKTTPKDTEVLIKVYAATVGQKKSGSFPDFLLFIAASYKKVSI